MAYRILSFCFVTIILSSTVFAVMDDPDTGKTVPPVVSFRTGTLEAVMRRIYTQSYPAPLIRSHWHIQNIAVGEEKSKLILEREIGFTLALRLEDWAEEMQQKKTAQENHQYSWMLLDLSDWITSQKGYGNFLLGNRCLDIACVGLGRAIADLEYPLDGIESLMSRLDPVWYSPKIRADILNGEAGYEIFKVTTSNVEAGNKYLKKRWKNGVFVALKQREPEGHQSYMELMKKSFEKDLSNPEHSEEYVWRNSKLWEEIKQKFNVLSQADQGIMSNLAFFDSRYFNQRPKKLTPGLSTVVSLWNSSRFSSALVAKNYVRNVNNIKALLTFRKTIGEYPTKLNFSEEFLRKREEGIRKAAALGIIKRPFEESYKTETEAAFDWAWRPHSNYENQHVDSRAASTYLAIQENRFYDEDTKHKKAYEKRQQCKQGTVDSSSDAGS